MASPPPPGIYVPVPTFFASSNTAAYDPTSPALDLDAQTAHSLFLLRGGIKGLVLLGSTGEAIHLQSPERDALIASQRRALDAAGFASAPLIAGTASQNIPEVLAQIASAAAAGAAYAMVLAPGYFAAAAGQDGVARWFEAVADAAALPVLVYHYPGVTNGLYISAPTFARLARHANIVGCKLSHGDVPEVTLVAANPEVDGAGFAVFTGLGQNLLPVLAVGGQGAIDGLAGVVPRTVVELYNLWDKAKESGLKPEGLEEMRKLQYRICQGERLVAKWGTVGIKEAIARLWGIGGKDSARLPLAGGLQGGEKEWAAWSDVFDGLKEYEVTLEKGAAVPSR